MTSGITNGKLSAFKPSKRNSNKHTAKGLKALDNSMTQDGYVAPMTAAADGEILDGSARLETAFDKFGDNAIIVRHDGKTPIVMVAREDIPNANDPMARRIHYRANTVQFLDFAIDPVVLQADLEAGFDLASIDLTLPDLSGLLDKAANEMLAGNGGGIDTEPQIDKAAELQEKWQTELGQMWQLGRHKIICGDCTDRAVVERLMGGENWAVMFTDPPYGINYDNTSTGRSKKEFGTIQNDNLDENGLQEFYINFLSSALMFSMENSSLYVCGAIRTAHVQILAAKTLGIHFAVPLVWVKQHFALNWDRYHPQHEWIFYGGEGSNPTGAKSRWFGPNNETTVWTIDRDNAIDYRHPTQKPIALPERGIKNSSTSNEVIYDPFLGSGTTLIACENLNRRCRACEIEPKYVAVALQRWADHTKQQPTLISTGGEV